MRELSDLITVSDLALGQIDRSVRGAAGSRATTRVWRTNDPGRCWVIADAGGNDAAVRMTPTELRAFGLACLQTAAEADAITAKIGTWKAP